MGVGLNFWYLWNKVIVNRIIIFFSKNRFSMNDKINKQKNKINN